MSKKKEYYTFLCPECKHIVDTMVYYTTENRKYLAYFKEENGITDIEYDLQKIVSTEHQESFCEKCESYLSALLEPWDYAVKIVLENGELKVEPLGYYWKNEDLPKKIYVDEVEIVAIAKKLLGAEFLQNGAQAIEEFLRRGIPLKIEEKNNSIVVVISS